jgi:hypothetical protein
VHPCPRLRLARPDDIAWLRSATILYSDYPEICQAGKHSDDQPSHFKFRLENFYHNITAIRKTRFFVTDEGAMGMGPLTTRPDDLVFVFRGGSLAFVLRPLGRRPEANSLKNPAAICYSLVGYCYIHGIMDGEIMGRHDIDEQIVCLL